MAGITPEMIAAGRAALVRFNPDYEREADAVVRIFEAMLEARAVVRRGQSMATIINTTGLQDG